jgi:hypothetical protein
LGVPSCGFESVGEFVVFKKVVPILWCQTCLGCMCCQTSLGNIPKKHVCGAKPRAVERRTGNVSNKHVNLVFPKNGVTVLLNLPHPLYIRLKQFTPYIYLFISLFIYLFIYIYKQISGNFRPQLVWGVAQACMPRMPNFVSKKMSDPGTE